MLSLAYAGNQGHRLMTLLPINLGNPQLCLSLTGCGPFGEQGIYTRPDGTVVNGTRSPFGLNFGDEDVLASVANSNYNALQVEVRHTSGRLALLAGYTYSKALDNSSSEGNQVLVPFNQRLSRSLAAFDATHNFVISYSYLLPFDELAGNRWLRLTSGWTLVGITHFTTGFPVTLRETDDRSLLGSSGIDRPDFLGGSLHITNPRTRQPYFDPSQFTVESLGQLGTADERFFHGPGLNNFDMALLKDLKITETVALQFRGEFFNIFNHAQFSSPDGNINDDLPSLGGTFGLVTSALSPRIGQVAMKLLF